MEAKREKNEKVFSLHMTKKTHKYLKKLSYLTEKSMTELLNEGVSETIKRYQNILNNSDIKV